MNEEDRPPNRLAPTVSIVGAAIAVLVVGLAAVLLLGGGNSGSSGTPQTTHTAGDAGSGAGVIPNVRTSSGCNSCNSASSGAYS